MPSLLLLAPKAQSSWTGEPPYELLLVAGAAARAGMRVRLVDFNIEPLDFGLLADLLASDAPHAVVMAPATSEADEAYRLGRFVKATRGSYRVIYGGSHAAAFPSEATARGAADLVVPPPAWAGVMGAMRSNGAAVDDVWPAPAFHAIEWRKYTIAPHWFGASPTATFQARRASGDEVRHDAFSHLEDLAGLGICRLRFLDDDLLEDTAGLRRWCSEWRHRHLPLAWTATTRPASVLALDAADVAELAGIGCIGFELAIGSGDETVRGTADAQVLAAVARLQEARLTVHVRITAWTPGETLASPRRVQRLVAALGSTRVAGEFYLPPLGSDGDGVRLSRAWAEHTADRVSWVPRSLVSDVPRRRADARVASTHAARLDEVAARMSEWLSRGLYVTTAMMAGHATTTIADAAGAIVDAIDGSRSVGDIVAASGVGWPLATAALAGLALAGLVDVDDPTSSIAAFAPTGASASATPIVTMWNSQPQHEFFCSRPWTGFEVGEEDGAVTMCCWAKDSYGNVNTDSIARIWNGPKIRRMRQLMAAGQWQEICRPHCPYIAGYMNDPEPDATPASAFAANLAVSRREIAERRDVLASWPRFWKAAHSTLCNLDCIMCYQDRKSTQTLPASFYDELPKYFPVMQELLLMGGEPLVIREMRRVVEQVAAANVPDLQLAFITNGTVFDARTLGLMRGVKLGWVLISLDAATPATYAHIRRFGQLDRALAGVDTWRALRDERGFTLVLSFTVMRDNVHELAEFVELAHAHDVDCQFSPVVGPKGDQQLLDEQQLRVEVYRALDTLKRLNATAQMPLAYSSLMATTVSA